MQNITDIAAEIEQRTAPHQDNGHKPASPPPATDYPPPAKPLHLYTEIELDQAVQHCGYCKGIGMVKYADLEPSDPRFGRFVPCPNCEKYGREKRNRKLIENMRPILDKYTMLKGSLLTRTFDNYMVDKAPQVWEAVREWTKNIWLGKIKLPWLYLHGPTGNGKTHLAAAAANGLLKAHIPTVFSTFTELCGMAAANGFAEKESVTRALQQVPVLIIDDVLDEDLTTSWKLGVLFRILDTRYATHSPTMVVSNLPISAPVACIKDYEPRIASRLLDHTLCKIVVNTADDYRLMNQNS